MPSTMVTRSSFYVTTGSGSQHWVTVIGYEGVDNSDNLSTDNFIILDPDRTSGLEPESLSSRGLTLRYGDWMGNVRISYASADVDDGRVPSEHFSDCFYGDWFVDSGVVDYVFDHGYITGMRARPCSGLRTTSALRGGNHSLARGGKPQVAREKAPIRTMRTTRFSWPGALPGRARRRRERVTGRTISRPTWRSQPRAARQDDRELREQDCRCEHRSRPVGTWTSSMTRTRSRLGRAMRLPGAPRRAF